MKKLHCYKLRVECEVHDMVKAEAVRLGMTQTFLVKQYILAGLAVSTKLPANLSPLFPAVPAVPAVQSEAVTRPKFWSRFKLWCKAGAPDKIPEAGVLGAEAVSQAVPGVEAVSQALPGVEASVPGTVVPVASVTPYTESLAEHPVKRVPKPRGKRGPYRLRAAAFAELQQAVAAGDAHCPHPELRAQAIAAGEAYCSHPEMLEFTRKQRRAVKAAEGLAKKQAFIAEYIPKPRRHYRTKAVKAAEALAKKRAELAKKRQQKLTAELANPPVAITPRKPRSKRGHYRTKAVKAAEALALAAPRPLEGVRIKAKKKALLIAKAEAALDDHGFSVPRSYGEAYPLRELTDKDREVILQCHASGWVSKDGKEISKVELAEVLGITPRQIAAVCAWSHKSLGGGKYFGKYVKSTYSRLNASGEIINNHIEGVV